jgi:Phage integrase, N-terminal SAM-like domain
MASRDRGDAVIVHKVLAGSAESWTVLGEDGLPAEPAEAYLAHLAALERSPNTLRAYAHSLRMWLEFLSGQRTGWREAGVEQVARFAAWLRAGLVAQVDVVLPARQPGVQRGIGEAGPAVGVAGGAGEQPPGAGRACRLDMLLLGADRGGGPGAERHHLLGPDLGVVIPQAGPARDNARLRADNTRLSEHVSVLLGERRAAQIHG